MNFWNKRNDQRQYEIKINPNREVLHGETCVIRIFNKIGRNWAGHIWRSEDLYRISYKLEAGYNTAKKVAQAKME